MTIWKKSEEESYTSVAANKAGIFLPAFEQFQQFDISSKQHILIRPYDPHDESCDASCKGGPRQRFVGHCQWIALSPLAST